MISNLRIDTERLISRIEKLGKIGSIEGGGVCRLALSDEDRKGRDLVIDWMKKLNFQKTNEESIPILSLEEATSLYKSSQFQEGSMSPKIESILNFLNAVSYTHLTLPTNREV